MSDLPRLTGSSPNAMTRALLEAGRGDSPSDEARMRAAVAIGVAATIATTATAGGAAGAASGGAAVSKWLASLGVLKVAGVTVVAGAVVVSASPPLQRALFEPSPTHASVAVAAPVKSPARAPAAPAHKLSQPAQEPEPAPVLAEAPAESAAPEAAPVAVPVAPAREAPSAPAAIVTRAAPLPKDTPTDLLRAEVVALDRARASIGAGDGRRALRELDDYERTFPSGTLRDEASVLQIEALAASGDVARAKRFAALLLASDPDSPHARRVRSLLAALAADAGAP